MNLFLEEIVNFRIFHSNNKMFALYSCILLNFKLQLNSDRVQDILAVQRIDLSTYNLLFVPGVEWILQCIAHKASDVSLCSYVYISWYQLKK